MLKSAGNRHRLWREIKRALAPFVSAAPLQASPRIIFSRDADAVLFFQSTTTPDEDDFFTMAATPPDGSFPRLNSSMVRKGSFAGMLASLVGKFEDSKTFRCCDGGTVQIIDFQDAEENMKQDLVVEIMGQVEGQESFSVR